MYENNLRLFDPRKSSVWRLTLAFAAITAVTLLLAITLIYQLLLGEQSRQVERRLDAEKTRIEALASEFDKQSFFQQLDEYRFDKLRYLPQVANFSDYKDKQLL